MGSLGQDLPNTEQQLFQISHLPILNTHLAEEIYHEKWEKNLVEVLSLFLEILPAEKALIESAHAEHNWQQINALAHKMKSGCLYMATEKLTIACQYLERYIKTGHTEQNEKLYDQMINTMNETVLTVSDWLKIHH